MRQESAELKDALTEETIVERLGHLKFKTFDTYARRRLGDTITPEISEEVESLFKTIDLAINNSPDPLSRKIRAKIQADDIEGAIDLILRENIKDVQKRFKII